ncbi:MAG: cyclase family protein [Nesterenkonia sp.]|uniref:cyclase family protein n=1 Tax=Nesterenkonia marinintestina TaxID=2979865 RepID=UPI0021C077C5|nr:cyclase family protein [Nesterenkonia sp. GX14115]MDO5492300.1 cyclase family protein [Nesterenkonia sp.]
MPQITEDLTRPITDAMMVYPGDPEVRLEPALTLQDDGVAVARLSCGVQTGTHLDAPCHTVPGGRTVSEVGLEELCGPTLVLHLDAGRDCLADVDDVRGALARAGCGDAGDRLPPRVLLSFGWDTRFGTGEALRHPAVSGQAAELLWDTGMRVLGTDALSPDPTGVQGADGFPVHDLVLGRDGLIVENLTRLRSLRPGVHRVGMFPLPLHGVDGAPVRAVVFGAD